jgi:mRNA-degrading endonuclease toxin of MazEF toxin-antitoxin module
MAAFSNNDVLERYNQMMAAKEEEAEEDEKKTSSAATSAAPPPVDELKEYLDAIYTFTGWLDHWERRERNLKLLLLVESRATANSELPLVNTTAMLRSVIFIAKYLSTWIKTNKNTGKTFPHSVITMEQVVRLWINSDIQHMQVHQQHTHAYALSAVELAWLSAVYGRVATNPKDCILRAPPHTIISVYDSLLTKWLMTPFKAPPTVAEITKSQDQIAAYYIGLSDVPFDTISIRMESATMRRYITERAAEVAEDKKLESKLLDADKKEEEEKEAKKNGNKNKKKKKKKKSKEDEEYEAKEEEKEKEATDPMRATREVILKRTNSELELSYREFRARAPTISISWYLMSTMCNANNVIPYGQRNLESFTACKKKIEEVLKRALTNPLHESTKIDMRELIYELSLPCGVNEYERRSPDSGTNQVNYTYTLNNMHKKGISSILGHRLKKPLDQYVAKLTEALRSNHIHDIEKMILPAVWIFMYGHLADQAAHGCAWFKDVFIGPSRLREAFKWNLIDSHKRYGNERRPLIVLIGSTFYVHNHFKVGASEYVSRYIACMDAMDALTVWTHIMLMDKRYAHTMDNGYYIGTRWLVKFGKVKLFSVV